MPVQPANQRYFPIGAIIYALTAALWIGIGYGLGVIPTAAAAVCLLLPIALAIWATMLQRGLPAVSVAPAKTPNPGPWFGALFALEGLAIGTGSGILVVLEQPQWIAPYVALVVALHFFPLAYLLQLNGDYILGGGMILLVLLASLLLVGEVRLLVITLGTAGLLWLAGWGRLLYLKRLLVSVGDSASRETSLQHHK